MGTTNPATTTMIPTASSTVHSPLLAEQCLWKQRTEIYLTLNQWGRRYFGQSYIGPWAWSHVLAKPFARYRLQDNSSKNNNTNTNITSNNNNNGKALGTFVSSSLSMSSSLLYHLLRVRPDLLIMGHPMPSRRPSRHYPCPTTRTTTMTRTNQYVETNKDKKLANPNKDTDDMMNVDETNLLLALSSSFSSSSSYSSSSSSSCSSSLSSMPSPVCKKTKSSCLEEEEEEEEKTNHESTTFLSSSLNLTHNAVPPRTMTTNTGNRHVY